MAEGITIIEGNELRAVRAEAALLAYIEEGGDLPGIDTVTAWAEDLIGDLLHLCAALTAKPPAIEAAARRFAEEQAEDGGYGEFNPEWAGWIVED